MSNSQQRDPQAGPRTAVALAMQRQRDREETERKRRAIKEATEASIKIDVDAKFARRFDDIESALRSSTVGLVTLAEMRQQQEDYVRRREEEVDMERTRASERMRQEEEDQERRRDEQRQKMRSEKEQSVG